MDDSTAERKSKMGDKEPAKFTPSSIPHKERCRLTGETHASAREKAITAVRAYVEARSRDPRPDNNSPETLTALQAAKDAVLTTLLLSENMEEYFWDVWLMPIHYTKAELETNGVQWSKRFEEARAAAKEKTGDEVG